MRTPKFDFLSAMAARGARPRPSHGCLSDGRFYFRMRGTEVDVAVAKDFDRWANSVDYVFSIPKTQKSFDRIMLRLADSQKESPREVGKALRI